MKRILGFFMLVGSLFAFDFTSEKNRALAKADEQALSEQMSLLDSEMVSSDIDTLAEFY